jgi:hypothetical protein
MASTSWRSAPRLVAGALLSCGLAAAAADASPVFVNGITVPASTQDLSADPIAINRRFGAFSDLFYDPIRNEYWALGDRGPGGGTLPYDTRVQRIGVDIDPISGAVSNFKILQTVRFTDATGALPFTGLAPSPTNVLGRSLDPEGFVVHPNGHFLVSDEYGPSLYEFGRDGRFIRAFTTPANLIPRSGTGVPNFAGDAGNVAGKRTNRGFEGLAISPDGKFAYAMLQSAMLDEGAGGGVYNRIVKFDTATGKALAQYAYQMEGSNQGRGISSLVALNDHEFLVLERNNRGVGVPDANLASPNKKVFKIDITGAIDVTGVTLPATGAFAGAVTKTAAPPFMVIDANALAALGGRIPEKWEGLTIGPRLADGQFAILVGTDNDFSITQNADGLQFDVYFNPAAGTRIQCDLGTFDHCTSINADGSLGGAFTGDVSGFALIPAVLYSFKSTGSDLAGFVALTPLPAQWWMLAAGAGLLAGAAALARRRRP